MRRRVDDDPSWRGATIAGVDEAGRGPLAGPVAVAAVVLDPARRIDGLRDSKAIPEARREVLFPRIQSDALAFAIVLVHADEIDRLNILQATMAGMRRAVAALAVPPSRVLVDGNRVPSGLGVEAEAIVKGDAKIAAISAASILAKVARDRWMLALDAEHPGYGFAAHKGYPTPEHLDALRRLGPCPAHRRSFAPVRDLLAPGLDLLPPGPARRGHDE
ncbi:MAG: ribonuclease HII [Lysobacteraceae bacterium]|jgi:ribonuclease HII|nr:ribonuclease HII [Xanthomonadaceae bacterium]MCZ8318016.1 ribonuclease HII [Silanimonas sp.]